MAGSGPVNQPPTANAGSAQTIILPASQVTLTGSGSDPDGTIASYAWTQVSGTAATIASPNSATTNITGLTTAGVRIFRLTVTDNGGATGTSDVTITVNSAQGLPFVVTNSVMGQNAAAQIRRRNAGLESRIVRISHVFRRLIETNRWRNIHDGKIKQWASDHRGSPGTRTLMATCFAPTHCHQQGSD